MRNNTRWPDGAYCTVRCLRDSWAAIVAVGGRILEMRQLPDRAEAFRLAVAKAEYEGLPCLVQVMDDLPPETHFEAGRA